MHTPNNVSRQPRSLAKRTRSLHKITGLAVAIPVIVLVLTGLPLEFVDQLKLGSRGVPYEWVHGMYGVPVPDSATQLENVVQVDDLIIIEPHTIERTAPLLATHDLGEFTMLLTQTEWLLVPVEEGSLPERGQLPELATRATFAAGLPVIESANGLLTSTDYGASWQPLMAPIHNWPQARMVPMQASWKRIYGANIVTWERWLQDLHSGRFFGQIGQWIMSIAGFALVVLAFSGLLIWLRTARH